MSGTFLLAKDARPDDHPWGRFGWICRPPAVGGAQLAVIEAAFLPGKGHSFHKHPRQEEVIYVLSGRIEQWIGKERRYLEAGDAAFIPADMVHASFNNEEREAKILAILGPSVGDGYETVEMAGEAPWSMLRG